MSSSAASSSASTAATSNVAASVSSSPSILVVLGCTGAGKTKLSLDLCRRFRGEVVSADSIQVYAGLPIASNQLSKEEADGIVHHGLAVLPPHRAMHVHDFRRMAQRLIAQIHARGNTAVIVGGTFYWMESILFKTMVSGGAEGEEANEEKEREEEAAVSSRASAAAVEPLFSMPDAAPLSLEQLQSLTAESIATLSTEHLAFACSILLARLPRAECPATSALLRHLSSTLSAAQFQQLLAAMPREDVRSVRFVSAILGQPAAEAAAASSSQAAAAASASAAPPSIAFPSPHLLELLTLIDPHTANRLHPNDGRKLQRALGIFVEQAGQSTMSQLIAASGGKHGTGLQYRVQAVWLDCLPDVLDARLDARVDEMMTRGLVAEAEAMYVRLWSRQQRQAAGQLQEEEWSYHNAVDPNCEVCAHVESRDISLKLPAAAASESALPAPSAASASSSSYLGPTELLFDWERGIGQALGFKEFRPYFKLKFHTLSVEADSLQQQQQTDPANKRRKTASGVASDPVAAHEAALAQCLTSCVQSLKDRTRQYARVQNRWIRSRLWAPSVAAQPAAADAATPPASSSSSSALSILRLDSSQADKPDAWASLITAPAIDVCTRFMAGEPVNLDQYAHLASGLPALPAASSSAVSSVPTHLWTKRRCDSCDALCNGPAEWDKHLRSKRHQRSTGSAAREEKRKQQMDRQEEVRKQREDKKAAAASAAAAAAAASSSASDPNSMQ